MNPVSTAIQSLSTVTHNRYRFQVQGCDAHLDVERFTGHERLSHCYRYQINFTSSARDLQPQQLLRRSARLEFVGTLMPLHQLSGVKQPEKIVHGIVTDFKRLSGSADQAEYQVTIEPFFALLRHQHRSHRFFLNQSVPQVIEQILLEHNFRDWEFEFDLKREYPVREQINQIGESDLAFIERLLSELGIFYHFSLQKDTKTEVICFGDQQSCYSFDHQLPLNSPSGMSDSGQPSIWGLSLRHQVVENSVQVKDYNHRQAQELLLSMPADMTRGDGEELNYGEVYNYSARHSSIGERINPEPESGHFWARLDHERFLVRQTRLRAISNEPQLAPAQVLSIQDSNQPSRLPTVFQKRILITGLRFTASRAEALSIGVRATPYSETLCWRPVLKPRPVISGTLTARITSVKNNDIYAHQNAHGHYWVKFDADLDDDKRRGYESMPVRLAKAYAGDNHGLHLPLIQGTEVAIAFHEGDPDRPYIAHALHDSRHPDHVTELNNTRNILRTPANNKLRMEDKRGQEHIKLSTEYGGKSQLNLGHLVDSERQQRGEGFELRTDDWGAIRAGKGLFISADEQSEAHGQVLAMNEALQQLQQAEHLVESLRSAAEVARAELADLQQQKELLNDSLTDLRQAGLLVSAPKGIAQTTPSNFQLSAGKNFIATSGESTDISSFKAFRLAAGERISLFAHKLGIKLFAAKGNVEVQAQEGEINMDALKDIRISSTQGKLVISAKQEILLVSGSSYIRIGDGVVESGAPDKIIQRAAVWQKFSGKSASDITQQWDKADFSVLPKVAWPFDSEPVKAQDLEVVDEVSGASTATTSSSGAASKYKAVNPKKLNVYLKGG